MIIPRVGDVWEFYPTTGKRHTTIKQIVKIYWRYSEKEDRENPWIEWSHTPSARYIGDVRVKHFLAKKAKRLVRRDFNPA